MIDLSRLSAAVRSLDVATDFDAAQRALTEVATAINMPTLAWSPDVSRPMFNPHMDAFLRRQGWSEEVLSLWWDRSVMLRTPIYIRCRTHAMPFVTGRQAWRAPVQRELLSIAQAMERMGVETLITAPVHLPRGQIAMVTWGGPQDAAAAEALLAAARIELIAAAHLFLAAYHTLADPGGATEEETVRFTPREWECLRLTAQGCREDDVASLVGIAATTVRFHLDNAVRKLGASNRVHAVARAAQLGILGPIS